MSKKTIWILFILGMALTLIGVIAYVMTIVSLATSSMGTTGPTPTPPDVNGMLAGFGIAILFLLAGGVIELIGRIGILIRQAKQQEWAWFVCTLLLGWVCMLVYLIVWPEAPQIVMATPVYVPQYQPMPPYQSYQAAQQPYYYERAQQQQAMEQLPPQE